MLWDLYCRVIDNHGDVGVCWRLAADLATRGEAVRLWIDDASALAWMAPHGAAGVTVHRWPGAADDAVAPGDVVIEAFGCALPPAVEQRMAQTTPPPTWINLEYLSAESYVERSHRLASPQPSGLRKWFFYPGFTARTGGLLRERDLSARREAFDRDAWLRAQGFAPRAGVEVVSLFCYEQPQLNALIDELALRPTLLLATFGHSARQVEALLGPTLARGELRAALLPPLTQRDYDHLLWASDLNFVRGEDSFVRAQWAARPFVWQIYPQHDEAHRAKLEAFLALHLAGAPASLVQALRAAHAAWNAGATAVWPNLPARAPWLANVQAWCARLLARDDLVNQLQAFVAKSR